MTSYGGEHAQLYDIFYAAKPYAEEARWVQRMFTRHAGGTIRRVLELACGTGKHALELEKLGYDVLATDYSPDLLEVAQSRAKREQSRVTFVLQDMTALSVSTTPFDAVVCLFDSIGYVRTNENIAAVMSGVRNHLRHGGLFIVEFWHAAAMIRNFDPVRVRRFATDRGELLRISETSLHHAEQIAEVRYTIHRFDLDGRCYTLHEIQRNRYFLPQEFKAFLDAAGLELLAMHAGFSDSTAISAETWHILAVARRVTAR